MNLSRATVLTVLILASVLAVHAHAAIPPVAIARKLPPGLTQAQAAAAVWRQPVSIPRFEYYVFDYLPSQQTEVRLAYDDENLYAAFRCLEEQMGKLSTRQTVRDSSVTKDDSVSLMLDTEHGHKRYVILSANAAGTQCDQEGSGEKSRQWNCDWSVLTGREPDAWKVLMVVPFKSLGRRTPRLGESWGVNMSRVSVPFHERSCWSTIRRVPMDVGKWGDVFFGTATAPIVSVVQNEADRQREFFPCGPRAGGNCGPAASPISFPGMHPLRLAISNPGRAPLKLAVEILVDDKMIGKYKTVARSGSSAWNLRYNLPIEGDHELKITARDYASGKVLMRTPGTLVHIPSHKTRLRTLLQMVGNAPARTAGTRSEKARVEGVVAQLVRESRLAESDRLKWEKLGQRIKEAEKAIGRLRALCADTESRGYAVGTETSLRKIERDAMFEGRLGEPLRISSARNEYESAQVVVLAHDRDLRNVKVSVTSLTGPGGAMIGADRVQLNLVDFVKPGPARYAADYTDWVADPLPDNAPFDVNRGALRPVWVTVHPPEKTPSGLYKGWVIVKPANAKETWLPFEVKVWNFTLPQRMAMKTAFALFDYEINAWYGKFDDAMRRDWYSFMLEHRINPTNIYSKNPVPEREYMPFCVERGLNAFTLTCTWYKEGKGLEDLLSLIRGNEKYLKANGWWDMPYVYGFDELGHDKYPELRSTYGDIRRNFPDLARMATVHPNIDLEGYVDIWVPLTANWIREDAEAYTKAGDQVWWYVCCHPFHPYPNFFTDYNAVDPRILFWMNWKHKVPGVLYYAMNIWEHNRVAEGDNVHLHEDPQALKDIAAGKRWPEVPWNTFSCASFNGDGQLIYPGPNGRPMSSQRLECIRDGIEDYEYFHQLNALVEQNRGSTAMREKARKLLKVRDDVVKSPSEYTLDPRLVLEAREEVAEMIEALSR